MKTNYQTIETEIAKSVLTIRLNRPQVRNAFNQIMLGELIGLLAEIDERDDIRVVIITGNGKSFCAGADLNWMKEIINYSFEENLKDSFKISELFYKIYSLKKPVIAAINGAAVGGGMGFVAASDIVIASEQAKFSLSEVRIGLVPACIFPYLIKKIPEGILKELFITGMRFGSQKALEIRLINHVAGHEKLGDFSLEKAGELLHCGPNAVSTCKKLFIDVPDMNLKDAYAHTTKVLANLRISAEAQEGMKAFLEKRTPDWAG